MKNIIKPVSFKKVIFSLMSEPLNGLWYSTEEVSPILSYVIIGVKNFVPSSEIIVPEGEAKK